MGGGGASGRALHCCLAYNCHINLPGQDKSHSPGSGAAIVAAPADWRAARPAKWHEERAGRAGRAAQAAQWQSHFALKSPKGRLAKIETSLEEMPSPQSALRACGPRQLRSNRKCTSPIPCGHYIMYSLHRDAAARLRNSFGFGPDLLSEWLWPFWPNIGYFGQAPIP